MIGQTREQPRVRGVSRVADNEKVLLVSFDRAPTDDELREFHEAIRDLHGRQT